MPSIVISGWPSTDRVPGTYGEVKYGQGAQSAGSIPKKCLIVGLTAAGASNPITPDTEVRPIFQAADADAAAFAGAEASTMAYDALTIPGTQLYMACPTPGAGATAATAIIDFTGSTPTASGSWTGRFAGTRGNKNTTITVGIASTDTAINIASNVASAINSYAQLPYTAANSGTAIVTLTMKSLGARGNQAIFFQDTSALPSGVTSYIGGQKTAIVSSTNASPIVVTATGHNLTSGDYAQIVGHVTNTTANGTNIATVTGANTFSIPVAGVGIGGATGSVYGPQVLGGGARFVGGTVVETYTALLTTLAPQKFDRIALACNDSTSLAAWKTQIDNQAGVLQNIRQHVVFCATGTLSAAQSLAQTTLNDQRFECLWHQNSETFGPRIAAVFTAFRSVTESSDPAAAAQYAGWALPTVQPQSQGADRPIHSVQNSALLNGVTPITTTGDGNARIVRAIVTHSLNGSNPDYSTFDVSDASCPDFVLDDIQLYDTTVYFVNNLGVSDDPSSTDPPAPAGIATPALRNAAITSKLRDYEAGVGFPTRIIQNVSANLPYSAYDAVGKRILTAINVVPRAPNVQVGNSVRQVTA